MYEQIGKLVVTLAVINALVQIGVRAVKQYKKP